MRATLPMGFITMWRTVMPACGGGGGEATAGREAAVWSIGAWLKGEGGGEREL